MKGVQGIIPQFDPAATGTVVSLISGRTEHPIPTLSDGTPPKYVMISVPTTGPTTYRVGQTGVDEADGAHCIITRESGPQIVNVAGMAAIDFASSGIDEGIVAPLANQ